MKTTARATTRTSRSNARGATETIWLMASRLGFARETFGDNQGCCPRFIGTAPVPARRNAGDGEGDKYGKSL